MRQRVVDLGWLRLFVEVAKRGNLTSAAAALGISQPAISYQIRRIEDQIGVDLLTRVHRGVELTPAGQRLYDIAKRAVDEIDDAVGAFRADQERSTIRLLTDYAFASLWLMPRMHAFRLLYPELDIQIVATQRLQRELLRDNDIAVAFGAQRDFGDDVILLLPEAVTPVCTPAFAEQNGPFADVSSLARSTLIHLDSSAPSPWFEWRTYLSHFRAVRDVQSGHVDLSFNTYSLVVQAAVGGQGIAIGWRGLVDEHISSGLLVPVGPTLEVRERGYCLVRPARASQPVSRLGNWLLSEAEAQTALQDGCEAGKTS
ncbi:choline sulfate utilization transcriptional regulator [Sinorhizobium alkalisoli]|uniref:LysR family transcriptional regulator n=1 Tax=Sinorhizobium alkalisoli TaxID=1752398 RepID=A0A1E3V8V8_9HYPH|nr:LysR family transcriptional regulator [Sinorhizobium alkalisoli]MCA1491159.1 LysR family transcriptional regulator [Ensifer sp. NBAIM29]MCG5477538.1 LysR family transcriptional regulator [Sinorhizobium alkalisoli]ODR89877.1 LysR family transcriptional regulator [Sinorhizobium alkalisoli]